MVERAAIDSPASSGAIRRTGTVHFIYPHGPRISTPDAIGRNLGRRLAERYDVRYYDWDARATIVPKPGDVLLGHPHPDANTIFRRSLREPGWGRKLALVPFNHADLRQVAFLDRDLAGCDLMLAITGPYWARTIESSTCSHWSPKLVHVDLAVDPDDFPLLKSHFNPPGSRRIAYIGQDAWYKNLPYLEQIAERLPGIAFGWLGGRTNDYPRLEPRGWVDFATEQGRAAVADFDFLLMVSTADANPTTILEAMAWGLIPVCTPQCGYEGIPSIPNVPLGEADAAAAIVRGLLDAPEKVLLEMQQANLQAIAAHYTWDRFARQVIEAIESDASPALDYESLARRLLFRRNELASPHGPVARRVLRTRSFAGRWRRRFLSRRTGAVA